MILRFMITIISPKKIHFCEIEILVNTIHMGYQIWNYDP